ncbi:permease [Campylobacter lari]|uniref:Arsenic resistance permease n=1 Tax=Campylobacter lari (strain RM2100 / D67 / ATCC BAA-1060) TaxID=306263 RepID=B9KG09_CAMLR|nr:permease [Campylobacter lari]ACM63994.1 arsenic resistance permease [Campylobacter lari RM2100]EAI7268581.1 permease [Campylobacter lari]EAJ0336674.1 permease [Campylobacter lari]EAK9947616.1 permease [Campylobacter lari]EDP6894752.1 permease [Campylobacter lari]
MEKLVFILKDFLILFIEISVLFVAVSILIAYLNERYAKFFNEHLKKDSFTSYIKAILLGCLTPFCSCSSIPLLNAFLKAKIPLGVCIAYLITSPLINPIIVVMFMVSFGLKISLFYVVFLFCVILFLAFCVSKINTQRFFNEDFLKNDLEQKSCCSNNTFQSSCCQKSSLVFAKNSKTSKILNFKNKAKESKIKILFSQSFNEYKKILPYIVIGMAIGAVIHGAFPQEFFQNYIKDYGVLGVFIAAFIGVLLYMNCTAMVPVALALTTSGIPLGIMMSFLIAGAGCSLPELILLKRIFKTSFLILFAGMIVVIAISFGLLMFFI